MSWTLIQFAGALLILLAMAGVAAYLELDGRAAAREHKLELQLAEHQKMRELARWRGYCRRHGEGWAIGIELVYDDDIRCGKYDDHILRYLPPGETLDMRQAAKARMDHLARRKNEELERTDARGTDH